MFKDKYENYLFSPLLYLYYEHIKETTPFCRQMRHTHPARMPLLIKPLCDGPAWQYPIGSSSCITNPASQLPACMFSSAIIACNVVPCEQSPLVIMWSLLFLQLPCNTLIQLIQQSIVYLTMYSTCMQFRVHCINFQ